MHRFFGLMALTAAGLGLYLLFGSDDAAAAQRRRRPGPGQCADRLWRVGGGPAHGPDARVACRRRVVDRAGARAPCGSNCSAAASAGPCSAACSRRSCCCSRPIRPSAPRPRDDRRRVFGYCLAPMLHINDLTFRIEGRIIFDKATAGIPAGHKVGLVGRNGSGKTTLLRLIAGELQPDDGGDQHAALDAHRLGGAGSAGRARQPDRLRAGRRHGARAPARRGRDRARSRSHRRHPRAAQRHRRACGPGARRAHPRRPRLRRGGAAAALRGVLRRLAHARGARRHAVHRARPAAARRADQLPRPRRHAVARGAICADYPAHRADRQPRPRAAQPLGRRRSCISPQGKLTLYTGGYDQFEEARREKQRLDLKLKKKQDDERRHIEAFIDRFKAKASKAAQAQSRIKALARMQPIAEQIEERVAPFLFPNPAKAFASPLIRLGGRRGRLRGRPAGAAGPGPAPRCRRPHRPARRQRQRQEHLRQADRRPPAADGGPALRLRQDRRSAISPSTRWTTCRPAKTPYQHMLDLMPEATEAQRRARLGALGFGVDKADTKAREPVGRREGAAAVRAGDVPRRRTC